MSCSNQCLTCPFRSTEERAAILRRLHDGPESIAGWEVGECHEEVGQPCVGYTAASILP